MPTRVFKGATRRGTAVIAAFLLAFGIVGFATAAPASADVTAADPICSDGRGTDGATGMSYAWADCHHSDYHWQFRIAYQCANETNFWRYNSWRSVDEGIAYAYCPPGKRVTASGVQLRYR